MTTISAWGQTEAYLLNGGADLSGLSRLDSIFGRHYDVLDTIDNVAYVDHRCSGSDCCEEPVLNYGPGEFKVLAKAGWVYAHLTQDGDVAYIGKTARRLPQRQKEHLDSPSVRRHQEKLLGEYADFIAGWNVGDACHRLETAAILVMQPHLNAKGI